MEYTIIDLKTFDKTKLYNVENTFYNTKGEFINKKTDCFLLNDIFLIPRNNISDHILLTSNGKNYLITKILKNNKFYDSAFLLDNNKAFEVYCYFKEKQSNIVMESSEIIDDYNMKLLNKWCCKFIAFSKKIDKFNLPDNLKKEYKNFTHYIFCQVLLCCTNNFYDEEFLIDDYELSDLFVNKCNSLSKLFDSETLLYLILKNYCNNLDLLKKFESFDLDNEKFIKQFSQSCINKYKSANCVKLILKTKNKS